MAKLTETLDGPTSGKRIIAPPELAPSFLGGLAKVASQGIDAFSRNEAQTTQIENTKALNASAQSVLDLQNQAASTIRGREQVPDQDVQDSFAAGTLVSPDVKAAAVQLQKTRQGVDQGRIAETQFELGLESTINTLYAKYPDQKALIGDYFQKSGLDHYMFRDQKFQDQLQTAGELGQSTGRTAVIDIAIKAGVDPTGQMSQDQLYQNGSRIAYASQMRQIASEAATESRAAAAEGRADSEFKKKQSDGAAYDAAVAGSGAEIGRLNDMLTNAVQQGGDSEDSFVKIQKGAGDFDAYITRYEQHESQQMAANHADKSTIDAFTADLEQKRKAMQDIVSGPMSRMQQKYRAFTNMQTSMGLAADKALPYYSWAKRTFGSAAMDVIFDGNPQTALSPELKGKIQQEMLHFDPTKPNEGFKIMEEMGALVKGDASLADIPESRITGDYIKTLNAGIRGARQKILDPEPDDPTEKKTFLGSLGNMVIAANRIQPGYKDVDGLDYALGSIVNNDNVGVLNSLMKDNTTKGQAVPLFMATRSATAKILEVTRNVTNVDMKVVNGQFVPTPSPSRPTTITHGGLEITHPATVDPKAARQAKIMNQAVDYLVNTAAADPATKGIDPTTLRSHYMNGTPLPEKPDGTKPAGPSFDENMNRFERELQARGDQLQTNVPFKRFESNDLMGKFSDKYGRGGAAGIVGNLIHESGGDPGANGDGGSAIGLAQWHPDRVAQAKTLGYDLSKSSDQIDFINYELEHGDVKAQHAGQLIREKYKDDPVKAAEVFAQYFERPKGAETGDPNQISGIEQRRRYARTLYGDNG